MQLPGNSGSLVAALRQRRQRLAEAVDFPVLLWSGQRNSRNFPANTYPFRASSHFLYFAGLPLENAVIQLHQGKLTLFWDEASPAAALWHGATPGRDDIADLVGAEFAYPLADLKSQTGETGTIAVQDPATRQHQAEVLNRPVGSFTGCDRALAAAIVNLRSQHDDLALAEIRQAIQTSVAAHQAGMASTLQATTEAGVRAAMEAVILATGMTCAYSSIVTVHGEVLHNDQYHHALQAGDLLLADVGAETSAGWASDITRTWPVSGQFSPSQQALYQVVLTAHDACIAQLRPGIEYRDIHLLACREIAAGLVDLGILKGHPEDLVEQDAHALFFPHGVGHLLGLDVHDMEDLGDRAGYAPGRQRSPRFGLGYLRLDRPLQPGMVVTIEPGFYQVPAILQDRERRDRYRESVNWERLAQFADVRGIRIEDDVLITSDGHEVLTAELPTHPQAIEQLVKG